MKVSKNQIRFESQDAMIDFIYSKNIFVLNGNNMIYVRNKNNIFNKNKYRNFKNNKNIVNNNSKKNKIKNVNYNKNNNINVVDTNNIISSFMKIFNGNLKLKNNNRNINNKNKNKKYNRYSWTKYNQNKYKRNMNNNINLNEETNKYKYIYKNKNNLIKFDIKDIKIFNNDNKVISIKKEIDIKNNFDIIETIPDGNCFYEAFLASLDIYKKLKEYYNHYAIIKQCRALSEDIFYLKKNNQTVLNYLESNFIKIEEYCHRIRNEEWAVDIIISLITKHYNLETRIIRYYMIKIIIILVL